MSLEGFAKEKPATGAELVCLMWEETGSRCLDGRQAEKVHFLNWTRVLRTTAD